MKNLPERPRRDLFAVAALAAMIGCKESSSSSVPIQNRAMVRNIVNAGPATFEGHDQAFLNRLSAVVLFTDINHENCELIATALSNPNPGTTLQGLKNQAVLPDMHRQGSDAAVSGQEYITVTVNHCRAPGRYMSCATLSDNQLTTYATIVEEYVTTNPSTPLAARMTSLVTALRSEVDHRQLVDRARTAGFIR